MIQAYSSLAYYVDAILALIGAALLVAASFKDLSLRILPNGMSLGCALAGGAMRLVDGTLPVGLFAAAAVFAGAFACWKRNWLGGGDVKLLAACALLVPAPQVVMLLMLTACCGGVLAIIYLLMGRLLASQRTLANWPPLRRGRSGLARRLWRVERRRIQMRAPLPYGCAIASAALILLLGPSGPLGK